MTAEKKEKLDWELEIPEGIEIKVERSKVTVKKGDKTLERDFRTKKVQLSVEGSKFKMNAPRFIRISRKVAGSVFAHLQNMFKGVSEGHVYKLKICAGHFPMNVSLNGNEFIIKNFLGEAAPRKFRIREGVAVKIDGTEIIVESMHKELAGQTAANIEQLTKIKNRDLTRFQDGIYIVNKDGKEI